MTQLANELFRLSTMFGVDEIVVSHHSMRTSKVRLRIGSRWVEQKIDFVALETAKSPVDEMTNIIFNAVEDLRRMIDVETARDEVMNGFTVALASGADLDRAAGLAGVTRDTVREKRPANRFEAVAEELKRFK